MILTKKVRYEQAVYGSFRFWSKGYGVLTKSSGCRPEWIQGLQTACQKFGEPPLGVTGDCGLFAMPLPDKTWMIVGAHSPGADDRGRSGALTFHALFVSPAGYRALGYSPFAIARGLRSDWGPEIGELPMGVFLPNPGPKPHAALTSQGSRADRIASALARGQKIAIEADGPIDDLAVAVWERLPSKLRSQLKVATWAFNGGNGFDLLAAPAAKISAITRDSQYRTANDLSEFAGKRLPIRGARPIMRIAPPLAMAAAAIAAGGYWLFQGRFAANVAETSPSPDARLDQETRTIAQAPPADPNAPPDRGSYSSEPSSAEEAEAAIRALQAFCARFHVPSLGASDNDLNALIRAIDSKLRYPGPWLSREETGWLRDDPNAGHALEWHEHLLRFAKDRPLPGDFEQGPLRWRLDYFAWSYHQPIVPKAPPQDRAQALADALARPFRIQSHPLRDHYSALKSYAEFLDKLPRR